MRHMHILRQVIQSVAIVAVAVVGIGLTMLLTGGSRLLSVQSGSMSPAIKKGDLISVKPTPTRDLRVGDVITYSSPVGSNQTITHRIVSISGDMQGRITTKGDANEVADQAVVPAQIVGRVERVVPFVGHLVDLVRHPIGLLLIIYVPALLLITTEMRELIAYYRRMRPYSIRSVKQARRVVSLPVAVLATALILGAAAPAAAALQTHGRLKSNTLRFADVNSSLPSEVQSPQSPQPTPVKEKQECKEGCQRDRSNPHHQYPERERPRQRSWR